MTMEKRLENLITLLTLGMSRNLCWADVAVVVRSAESMRWPECDVEALEWALRRECARWV